MPITTAEPDSTRVLVADDQTHIARMLASVLTGQGYQVQTTADGEAAFEHFSRWRPGLVMTDLYLPVVNGLELCRRIRARSAVPIIVVSGKGDEEAKVEALDAGADDYVTKPFGTQELLARVRAALRRCGSDVDESFDAGDFRVNMTTYRVHIRDSQVRLTPKEFDLFLYFARHPNRVLGHRRLLGAVWGDESLNQPAYVRVLVGQLRKKLEPEPSKPRYLVTEPWVGYTFHPQG